MPEMDFHTPPPPPSGHWQGPPPPPREIRSTNNGAMKGCLISCLLVAAGMALLVVIGGIGVYMFATQMIKAYVSDTPRPLPQVEMSAEERAVAEEKLDAFQAALESGQPAAPLVLTENEINLLLHDTSNPNLDFQWVYVDIVDGALRAEMSAPLAEMGLGNTYLNGSGEIAVKLQDGSIAIELHSLEANGKPVPSQVLDAMEQAIGNQLMADPNARSVAQKIESISVEGDTLVVLPKNMGSI